MVKLPNSPRMRAGLGEWLRLRRRSVGVRVAGAGREVALREGGSARSAGFGLVAQFPVRANEFPAWRIHFAIEGAKIPVCLGHGNWLASH